MYDRKETVMLELSYENDCEGGVEKWVLTESERLAIRRRDMKQKGHSRIGQEKVLPSR